MSKNEVVDFSGLTCSVGLFRKYFVCKNSFRVISMIKMVILNQSTFENKIIQNSKIHTLHVYYS